MDFLEALSEMVIKAGHYNKNDQSAPAVIIWTDKERQWEPLLPRLRQALPLLTFDPVYYMPEERRGPAYYLRCLLAHSLAEDRLPPEQVPVLYLPGFSKQELRAVEECPRALQALVELQYRGVFFNQKNGKDWTIAAFLQSKDGGLGIAVANDQATRDALKQTLLKLADVTHSELQAAAPIKEQFLSSLLHPDDVRSLLHWLNDPEGFLQRLSAEEWAAFCSVCKQKYLFNPEKDSTITAAEKLGTQLGAWQLVWERYTEAPQAYLNIPERLRSARPTQMTLFERSETWPQDNEAAENQLRQDFTDMENLTFQQACSQIIELEQVHGKRRQWVWAHLNKTPLANALKHMAVAVKVIQSPANRNSIEDISNGYTNQSWEVDHSILEALAAAEVPEDINAVRTVIQIIYRSWLEGEATAFQKTIANSKNGGYLSTPIPLPSKGTCILFSDALRMDLAHRLGNTLQSQGYECELTYRLSALPPVTATAKPALISHDNMLSGKESLTFDPTLITSKSLLTAESFRKLLTSLGFLILNGEDCGDPSGRGWTEIGEIDSYGHKHSNKLPVHIRSELIAIENRIVNLLDYGWKQVVVVTDHGWLLLPDGLPKVHLPEHLTILRKGRCARLKEGSQTEMQTLPWYWDSNVWIAFAPGIACFEAGKEYEHGGLSPQECVTPMMTIQKTAGSQNIQTRIDKVNWKGLRCSVHLESVSAGIKVDLRSKAGDATSSVATSPKEPDSEGYLSLVVEDDDRMGEAAFVVVLSSSGQPVAQIHTTIGG